MHIDSLIRRIGRRQRSTFQEAKRNSLSGAEAPSFMKKTYMDFRSALVCVCHCASLSVSVFSRRRHGVRLRENVDIDPFFWVCFRLCGSK